MASRYGLQIRAATSADASALGVLLANAGLSFAAADLVQRLERHHGATGTALLALEWGPPSGLVVLHWFRTLAEAAPVAQIDHLLVDPEARRRGIGRALLKAAAQAARTAGCDSLQISFSQEEPGMSAFCHATGFEPATNIFTRALRKKA